MVSVWCSATKKRALCPYLVTEAQMMRSTGLAVTIETVGFEAHFTQSTQFET